MWYLSFFSLDLTQTSFPTALLLDLHTFLRGSFWIKLVCSSCPRPSRFIRSLWNRFNLIRQRHGELRARPDHLISSALTDSFAMSFSVRLTNKSAHDDD